MSTFEMMKANEEHFNQAIRSIRNGGIYIWKDALEVYNIINQKFLPTSYKGYLMIKSVTTPEWSETHVIPYVIPELN